MMTRMKAKWQSNEEEGGTSQLPKSNVKEVMSASVRAQVPFHLRNLIKYLIFCQFVRYIKIEISHVFHTREIWIG